LIDKYARKHPDFSEEICELFPTITAIEPVKSASPGQTGGGPVPGGLSLERLGDFRIIRELGRGGSTQAQREACGPSPQRQTTCQNPQDEG
jgi:hypothetical protein